MQQGVVVQDGDIIRHHLCPSNGPDPSEITAADTQQAAHYGLQRVIVVRNEQIHRDLNVPTLDAFCRKLSVNFLNFARAYFNQTIMSFMNFKPKD